MSQSGRPMKVLHVVHGLGSGVESVVQDYARATPAINHHVVYTRDPTCHDPRWASAPCFTSTTEVRGGLLALARAVSRLRRLISPDLVHAHSSLAGLVTRTTVLRVPVVYTAHGFAFLRTDVHWWARAAFWVAEAILARRTAAFAACSPDEEALATRISRRVHYVPNVAAVDQVAAPHPDASPRQPGRAMLVTAGRIAPQKDPAAFATLSRQLRDHGVSVDLIWIGGGEDSDVELLRDAGVHVTGWLPRNKAISLLGAADLYVHTAKWESAPMTILEAAELGVPILARDCRPLRLLGMTELWTTTEELTVRVLALLSTGTGDQFRLVNERLRAAHHPQAQSVALTACYESTLRRTTAKWSALVPVKEVL